MNGGQTQKMKEGHSERPVTAELCAAGKNENFHLLHLTFLLRLRGIVVRTPSYEFKGSNSIPSPHSVTNSPDPSSFPFVLVDKCVLYLGTPEEGKVC